MVRQAVMKNPENPQELENGFEELKQQAETYKDLLQRLQADFENYKKRSEKENEELRQYAIAKFISRMLPVIDSFEMALKSANKSEGNVQFVEGVKMIYAQMHSLLESEGLRKINSAGEKFNPHLHEVLMAEDVESGKDNTDDIVLEEFQKGYMLKDAVLRHSKVKVGSRPKAEKPVEGKND